MSETEDIERVVSSLAKVPPKHLLIIELANNAPRNDEGLDYDALAKIQPEVNLAIEEAKMYGAQTLMAVQELKRLGLRDQDV